MTIPNIVNSYIALFKDTTLVFFVGIFDFLKTIEVAAGRPQMGDAGHERDRLCLRRDGLFRVCCYAMSRYAARIERRLAVGDRR